MVHKASSTLPHSLPLEFGKDLAAHPTDIPGLVWWDLPVHGDSRGWFKENWQREKMVALGLPDFHPVQNNISFNDAVGTTRGIHAEPWDKYVSVATGRVFGAWVDLREGDTFGRTVTLELDPTKAIFVPRGVANSFQVLEPDTAYTYLVNDHWSADAEYAFLNLADETTAIQWPIPLDKAVISDKDKAHPRLNEITPIAATRVLITGAYGQLGRALQVEFPDAVGVDRDELDITDPDSLARYPWRNFDTIINAAAYTAVDQAETPEGRHDAWKVNASAVQNLAHIARQHHLTLVHVSSDYVFDGTAPVHTEDEPFAPLNVYGQSKAAGDIAAALAPQHYITRTTWVVGEGKNFIETMKNLAEKGVKPTVVGDQIGRLTFTEDLARAIHHLLAVKAPYGTYNVTNEGAPTSWADIAKKTYELTGHNPKDVTAVSTEEYYADKIRDGVVVAERPLQSVLDLGKLKATGFIPRDVYDVLRRYLEK